MKLFGVQLFGRSDPAPVRKAMEYHRKSHPVCAACGNEPVDVHHIIPVAVDPSMADEAYNLISLCHACHIAYGHAGDKSCRRYVPNLQAVLRLRFVEEI